MSDQKTHRITLQPVGAQIQAAAGTPLRDLLFDQGVEFPCGGQGRCRGCRTRVVEGRFHVNAAQREQLTEAELADGWRLACQCHVEGDAVVELRQWEATSILSDESTFAFTPREGLGVAVDVGTTTVVAQLVDLGTGHVLAVRTALNPQARFGADVMSRVEFAVTQNGQGLLENAIRVEVGKLVRQLLRAAGADAARLRSMALVGNTVMHHLFSGLSLEPLSHTPFEPVDIGLQTQTPEQLGWSLPADVTVRMLPCLGGFVGSDILAGILATGLHESEELVALVDLGTNGEMVLGNRERLLCASTAAGPAFEGARISAGMRAAAGAIWRVERDGQGMRCEALGGVEPRGICGSGLVDTVAVALDLDLILPGGRIASRAPALPLCETVSLTQTDIREMQLAKGAIAAGIRLLLRRWGAPPNQVHRVYLAGAFGNYINRASARRIGLIDFPGEKVVPVGNTALLGAKMALFVPDDAPPVHDAIRARTQHVSLHEEPGFQDVYAEDMGFPRVITME